MASFNFIDFILNTDKYVSLVIQNYGIAVYPLLFLIIFIETGIVIFPFLPGDSMIFICGAFASQGIMNVYLLFLIFVTAAILGDTVNYWIGNYLGEKIFLKKGLIKKEHLEKTENFFKEYGGKTIIIARFIPIVRTFAPFVAGVGKMKYSQFLIYNIFGGLFWVSLFLFGGYFFGGITFVQKNLSIIVILLVLTSFIPPIVEFFKNYHKKSKIELIKEKTIPL